MVKLRSILKRVFFPVTLLTFLVVGSVLVAVNALYIWISQGGESAIYPAVTIPIMIFFICLYLVDRWLINKITYIKIMIGEGLILVGVLFFLLLQNKSTDINFETDKDFILVLFDGKSESDSNFENKWILGKELNVNNENIIHLNPTLLNQKNLMINAPKDWVGFIQERGYYKSNTDSIGYVFVVNSEAKHTKNQYYIDSLIKVTRIR